MFATGTTKPITNKVSNDGQHFTAQLSSNASTSSLSHHLISHQPLLHLFLPPPFSAPSLFILLSPRVSSFVSFSPPPPPLSHHLFLFSFCPSQRLCAEITVIMQHHALCSHKLTACLRQSKEHVYIIYTHIQEFWWSCNIHPSCSSKNSKEQDSEVSSALLYDGL